MLFSVMLLFLVVLMNRTYSDSFFYEASALIPIHPFISKSSFDCSVRFGNATAIFMVAIPYKHTKIMIPQRLTQSQIGPSMHYSSVR